MLVDDVDKMANSTLPHGFVKSVLKNGVGRYVCQLQRITFKFCKSFGGSRGVREFIENDIVDFAKQNPGIVVYLKPRRHRSPCLTAEYLNGHEDYVSCQNFTRDEVGRWLEYLKNKSGFPIVRLIKMAHTDMPSIQGTWTPFTNMPFEWNLTQFPDEKTSRLNPREPSSTDLLLKMMAEQQQNIKICAEEEKTPKLN